MLLIPKEKTNKKCPICIVKAVCNHICENEYKALQSGRLFLRHFNRFVLGLNKNDITYFKGSRSYSQIDKHFRDRIYHCPICGNKFLFHSMLKHGTFMCSYCYYTTYYTTTRRKWFTYRIKMCTSEIINFYKRNPTIVTYKEGFKIAERTKSVAHT